MATSKRNFTAQRAARIGPTQLQMVRKAVSDGAGTSAEASAMTGLSLKAASAYLSLLKMRGKVVMTGRIRRESQPGSPYFNVYIDSRALRTPWSKDHGRVDADDAFRRRG